MGITQRTCEQVSLKLILSTCLFAPEIIREYIIDYKKFAADIDRVRIWRPRELQSRQQHNKLLVVSHGDNCAFLPEQNMRRTDKKTLATRYNDISLTMAVDNTRLTLTKRRPNGSVASAKKDFTYHSTINNENWNKHGRMYYPRWEIPVRWLATWSNWILLLFSSNAFSENLAIRRKL